MVFTLDAKDINLSRAQIVIIAGFYETIYRTLYLKTYDVNKAHSYHREQYNFLMKLTFASVAFIERRTVTFVVTIGHAAVSTVKAGAWVTNVTWKETKVLGILQ